MQNLATLIVDPDGKGLESHWQKTSQALLVGVILHALYKARAGGSPATLPGRRRDAGRPGPRRRRTLDGDDDLGATSTAGTIRWSLRPRAT